MSTANKVGLLYFLVCRNIIIIAFLVITIELELVIDAIDAFKKKERKKNLTLQENVGLGCCLFLVQTVSSFVVQPIYRSML